jgi:hypothetical protein
VAPRAGRGRPRCRRRHPAVGFVQLGVQVGPPCLAGQEVSGRVGQRRSLAGMCQRGHPVLRLGTARAGQVASRGARAWLAGAELRGRAASLRGAREQPLPWDEIRAGSSPHDKACGPGPWARLELDSCLDGQAAGLAHIFGLGIMPYRGILRCSAAVRRGVQGRFFGRCDSRVLGWFGDRRIGRG